MMLGIGGAIINLPYFVTDLCDMTRRFCLLSLWAMYLIIRTIRFGKLINKLIA